MNAEQTREALAKVPAVTLGFWVIKILATTLGETGGDTLSMTYDLEYGQDTLEMHADAVIEGQRVLIVDDLLATGGTMTACVDLVRKLGGEVVGVAVLIELAGLNGRDKLDVPDIHSVLTYE